MIESIDFSPDGKTLALINGEHSVQLRDANSGRTIRSLEWDSEKITCLAFNPDGNSLALGISDKTIQLREITTNNIIRTFEGHTKEIACLTFSPDGTMLISGSEDETARLWETSTGKFLHALKKDTPHQIVFHPNGKFVTIYSHHEVTWWNVKTNESIHKLKIASFGEDAILSSNGNMLAIDEDRSIDDSSLSSIAKELWLGIKFLASEKAVFDLAAVFDIKTGLEIQKFQVDFPEKRNRLAFTPNEKFLVSSSYNERDDRCIVRIWQTKTGNCVNRLIPWHFVPTIRISSQNKLALGGWDGNLSLWNIDNPDSISLQWSTQPSSKLLLENANFSQAIQLSEQNQRLIKQKKAKGNPAHSTQPYLPWCTLFQPIIGTASLQSQHAIIRTPHQQLSISELSWVVSVARKQTGSSKAWLSNSSYKSNSNHSFLIMEGIRNYRRFIIRAELTVPKDSNQVTIIIKPLDDIELFQQSAQNYQANQWDITPEEGKDLLENIRADQRKLIQYNIGGSKSALTFFSSAPSGQEFHNCLSWCKKQLYRIGIKYPDRWYHIFAILPEDLTAPGELIKTERNTNTLNYSTVINDEETNELMSQFFIMTPEEFNQPRKTIESEANTEIPDEINPFDNRIEKINTLIALLDAEIRKSRSTIEQIFKNNKKLALEHLKFLLLKENYEMNTAIESVQKEYPKVCAGLNSRVKKLFDELLDNTEKSEFKFSK